MRTGLTGRGGAAPGLRRGPRRKSSLEEDSGMPHKFVELCCGGLMKAGKQVAASVECDCDGGVPETPGWAVQRISRLRQGVGLRAETRNEGRAAKPVPGLPIGAQGWRRRSRETAASARHPHAGCSRPSAVATRRRRRRTKHAAPRRRTQTFAPAPSGQRRCPRGLQTAAGALAKNPRRPGSS